MIELTSAAVILVSSLFGSPSVAVAQDVDNSINTQATKAIESPMTLQAYVEAYFVETPILAKIAKCESRFRQTGRDGQVLRGEVNDADVGLMQINEKYHQVVADELNLDLETVDGNLTYAKYLYEKQGTAPWNASKPCWGKHVM